MARPKKKSVFWDSLSILVFLGRNTLLSARSKDSKRQMSSGCFPFAAKVILNLSTNSQPSPLLPTIRFDRLTPRTHHPALPQRNSSVLTR